MCIAAKAALRRKKTHEHSLEQTVAQIGTLEQQINSIESANINRETLAAMEKAGQAMKQIHNGLTPEKVDETMYVALGVCAIRRCRVANVAGQGQTARSKRTERGDRQRHHREPARRTDGRARA